MLEEETSTKFIRFDQVNSIAIAAKELKRQSILHHIAAGWRYLTMYVAALRRAGALLSIAMHTFERLAVSHWTSLLTCLPHPRLVRAHENDQAPLT